MVPLSVRRAHRDWPAAEVCAWMDLFLASYEVDGVFDSIEVARAYLGTHADGVDGLIERGAFIEVDGTWQLTDYAQRYDGRRPRHHRSLEEHLASAAAKVARGEALSGSERWARWKARSQGRDLPDLRRRSGAGGRQESEVETEEEIDSANVGPTLGAPRSVSDPTPTAMALKTARSFIRIFKDEGAAARTEWCEDYREHQFQHRQSSDGSWRCLACALDPDHADPQRDAAARDWALENPGGAA
jgi:hypothetical protein